MDIGGSHYNYIMPGPLLDFTQATVLPILNRIITESASVSDECLK